MPITSVCIHQREPPAATTCSQCCPAAIRATGYWHDAAHVVIAGGGAVVAGRGRTLLNLGGDTQRLEEGCLGGVKGGGAGRDVDVALGDGVRARGGGLAELLDDVLDGPKVVANEEQADVANEFREEGAPSVVTLVLAVQADAALHERVLAHEDLAVERADGLHEVPWLLTEATVHRDGEFVFEWGMTVSVHAEGPDLDLRCQVGRSVGMLGMLDCLGGPKNIRRVG